MRLQKHHLLAQQPKQVKKLVLVLTNANQVTPAVPVQPETVTEPAHEGQTVDMQILSTTDIHTNLVNYDYYQDKPSQSIGLSKTACPYQKSP